MTHHWVGENQLAYSDNGVAYLHDLDSDERRALVSLPPHEFRGGQHFRVSPDGERIAYADFNDRLWVEEIESGRRQAIGWNVTTLGWEPGLVWRDDGEQLFFTTRNNTTLPDQAELWLWDAAGGKARLLVRTGPGFLGSDAETVARLWRACWINDGTVLLVANLGGYRNDVHLLAAATDGGGVWDVTPDDKPPFPYSYCAHGWLALNTLRTTVDLYEIVP
jgi:hypothetical protein